MKKAILVVSFGTTHEDTRKLTLDAIESRIAESYKDYEIRKAYTSDIIIRVLKKRDNITIDTPKEALEKLYREGFDTVIVQPLHVIPGLEYDYVKETVKAFIDKGVFKELLLGTPVIYEHDDYELLSDALETIIPRDKATIFMAHGSSHHANACYCELMHVLQDRGFDKLFIATVEGYPTLENAVKWLATTEHKEVFLTPLMVVAGDHAKNDMCGKEEDSWKNVLEDKGYSVEIYMHGLGEIEKFQKIYIKHIAKAIGNTEE